MKPSVVIVGAGNLAWHLAPAIQNSGYKIIQLFSRSEKNLFDLGRRIGVPTTNSIKDLSSKADLYLFMTPDDSLVNFSFKNNSAVFAHCSGMQPTAALSACSRYCGVIYPLQTFTKSRPIDCTHVPILIDGTEARTQDILRDLASSISKKVYEVSENERQYLHLSAVICNNFVNHMIANATKICDSQGLDSSILMPLIKETIEKLGVMNPREAQTGPAKRGDIGTLQAHLNLLKSNDSLSEVYQLISHQIFNEFNPGKELNLKPAQPKDRAEKS